MTTEAVPNRAQITHAVERPAESAEAIATYHGPGYGTDPS